MLKQISDSQKPIYNRPTYRPDIDGLRALAILSVVLFHAFPSVIKGGFIGVDIFFIISGYLISTIIFKGLLQENFSIAEFYTHRIKRIAPSLLTILLACFSLGWFLLPPDDFSSLGKHIATGVGFVQNFTLLHESGYFDTSMELKPLMHLWSLAIEEQFYLFFPLTAWLFWYFRKNWLHLILLLGGTSFFMNIASINRNPTWAFFSPQTRFWELLIGSLLAFILLNHNHAIKENQHNKLSKWWQALDEKFKKNVKNAIAFTGLFFVISTLITLHDGESFPGWRATLPTVGTALIIAAGQGAWINRKLLSCKPMIFIGLISYPLYLWHWPILSLTRILTHRKINTIEALLAVIASFTLAWLTYIAIEKPIRFSKHRHVPKLLSMMLIGMAVLGYVTHKKYGFPNRIPAEVREIASLTQDKFKFSQYKVEKTCRLDGHQTFCIEKTKPLIFLWGDSHAASLYPGLNDLQRRASFGIIQTTGCGNPPFLTLGNYSDQVWCDSPSKRLALNMQAFKIIAAHKPQIVILHARWAYEAYHTSPAETINKIKDTAIKIHQVSPHSKIMVIGPVPNWKDNLSKIMYSYWENTLPHKKPPIYMSYGLAPEIEQWDIYLRREIPQMGLTYFSAFNAMCTKEGCLTRTGTAVSDLTAVDYGHLSGPGAVYLTKQFEPTLLQLLAKSSAKQENIP